MRKLFAGMIVMMVSIVCAAQAQTPASANTAVKPPIRGLVTMGSLHFLLDPTQVADNTLKEANAHPGVYAGVVILAKWSLLEPKPGVFDYGTIDEGLAAIRKYNAKYPRTPVVGKLRVFGANNAPLWVKQLAGGPIMLEHKDKSLIVGLYWIQEYGDAWRELQGKLAARYDNNPLIEEVAISSCSPNSAEPFVAAHTPANDVILIKAGFTDEKGKACLSHAAADYDAWKHVALDFTFNNFKPLNTDPKVFDEAFTEKVMDDFRARFGSRGVIANHGIAVPLAPRDVLITQQIHDLGPPIEYQTIGGNVDWDASIALAEQLGVTEMEIWDTKAAGDTAKVSQEQLQKWKAELTTLQANAAK